MMFIGNRASQHGRGTSLGIPLARSECLPWLAWVPVASTAFYYGLPSAAQTHLMVQFLPQMCGYLSLAVWGRYNSQLRERLGLAVRYLRPGLRLGCVTGLVLGTWNTIVILWLVPVLGGDIAFLRDTPHARVPVWLMVPWGIVGIAFLVELNFRGFLLGRLAVALQSRPGADIDNSGSANAWPAAFAVGVTALVFCFDPFMVTTFRHLHWIALWDGVIWGWIWLRTGNLYAVVTAHAVEVVLMYLSVRAVLL